MILFIYEDSQQYTWGIIAQNNQRLKGKHSEKWWETHMEIHLTCSNQDNISQRLLDPPYNGPFLQKEELAAVKSDLKILIMYTQGGLNN